MSDHILVVDDEPDILELVRFGLTQEGFSVETANTAGEGLASIAQRRPDLVVLDLMLPDMSGTAVCRKLRAQKETATLPILMLTARGEELDRVVGFEVGADDYVTKPFSPRELALRVKAVLRRSSAPLESMEDSSGVLAHEEIHLDFDRHRCTVLEEVVELTAKEFGLLASLMRRPGRVFSREKLLDELWGSEVTVTHRTVDTHMKRLREKLGTAGRYILTVRGVGYRFTE